MLAIAARPAVLLEGHFELVRLAVCAAVLRCLVGLSRCGSHVTLGLILCFELRLLVWLSGRRAMAHLRWRALWTTWVAQRLVPFEILHWASRCHRALRNSLLGRWLLENWVRGRAWTIPERFVLCMPLSLLGSLMLFRRMTASLLLLLNPTTERLHVLMLAVGSPPERSLCLSEAILGFLGSLIRLNASIADSVQSMARRWLRSSIQLIGEIVILSDEVVDLLLNHRVLVVEHLNMIL